MTEREHQHENVTVVYLRPISVDKIGVLSNVRDADTAMHAGQERRDRERGLMVKRVNGCENETKRFGRLETVCLCVECVRLCCVVCTYVCVFSGGAGRP